MSKEEAIKKINEIRENYAEMDGLKDYVLAIETILKEYEDIDVYITELQHEIKELRDREIEYLEGSSDTKYISFDFVNKHYIFKDKIREKIDEIYTEKLNYSEDEYYLESEIKGYAIDHLKDLLGE